MIYPSTTDVLATVESAFESQIRPDLKDVEAVSAAATVSHLLRHVRLRIECEGRILAADIGALRALLPGLADFIAAHAPGSGALPIVRTALDTRYPSEYGWRGVDGWAEEAIALRAALEAALSCLQDLRSALGDRVDYQAQRSAIRDYISNQVKAEAEMIVPAFLGRGARR